MRSLAPCLAAVLASLVLVATSALALTHVNGVEIAARDAGSATSECPASLPAFAGGFYAPIAPRRAAEPTGFRARGRGWRVLAVNTGAEPISINSESYCGEPPRVRPVERSASTRVGPRASAQVVARCRRGETLLATGFRNSIDPVPGRHVVVAGMERTGVRDARVTVSNLSATEPGTATAYAYCGTGRRPVVVQRTETVEPGTTERVAAPCPGAGHDPDWRLIFAGFRTSAPDTTDGSFAYPAEFRNNGGRKVTVTAVNRSPDRPARMTALAYCR